MASLRQTHGWPGSLLRTRAACLWRSPGPASGSDISHPDRQASAAVCRWRSRNLHRTVIEAGEITRSHRTAEVSVHTSRAPLNDQHGLCADDDWRHFHNRTLAEFFLEPISKSETHHLLNPRHSGAGRNPVFSVYLDARLRGHDGVRMSLPILR